MAKTADQLDADIDEALREAGNIKLADEIKKLTPREQEMVLRVQEISALGEMLKEMGLHFKHGGNGRNGRITVWGKPTYELRDVLKKYGFRFDGKNKQWTRPTDYSVRPSDIDYLTFYNDMVKKL